MLNISYLILKMKYALGDILLNKIKLIYYIKIKSYDKIRKIRIW